MSNLNDFVIENSVLIKYKGPGGDVVIPDGVTSIGDRAFCDCSALKSITIPEGVTMVGACAFSWCIFLKSVTIPDGLTTISDEAFRGCKSVKSITLPDGVTSIGNGAFNGCESLKSIELPDGVTSIGNGAFNGCESLESIMLPKGVTTIGACAFSWCTSLESITLPEGVITIGDEAFRGCNSIKIIILPEGVTTIGNRAFLHCRFLENITLPESVTTIGTKAFSGCSGLANKDGLIIVRDCVYGYEGGFENVVIPDGVTSIGNSAFDSCKFLESITLPDGVTSIGDEAFRWCTSLARITLPESVTTIGTEAFSCCSGLAGEDGLIIVRDCVYGYKGKLEKVVIPERVTTIDTEAFDGCESLESITLPDGVTTIGDRAFRGCTSLKSVTLPDGVTTIGDNAFAGCKFLESITLPDGVTSIGDNAFDGCESLQSIMLPDGVTTIGDRAFRGCTSLKSVTLPDSVTSIGNGAFNGCESLESITLPDGVTSIGDVAFRWCTSLESITIPESVTSIGIGVFEESNLQTMVLPRRFCSELHDILVTCNVGILLREGNDWSFCAYTSKDDSDNLRDFAVAGKWFKYDLALINNGPVYKYRAPARLLGMLGRLAEPVELTEENRALHMEYLTKNAKKLVALAESINCPAIVRLMFELGIVNDKNKKALVKLLEASPVSEIAALACMDASTPASAAPAGEAPAAKEEQSELAQLYARKWEEIKGDRILKDMKLRGIHMPEVKLADGSAAPEKLFLYILVSYGRQLKTGYVLEPEADEAAKLLAYDSLCDAMEAVSGNLDGPAYPSVLPMICRFGSPRQIARLLKSRKEWGEWYKYGAKGRTAQTVLAEALVLSDTRAAVVFLEKQGGLSRYAALRGQSEEEVYENYLFDFGFDENGVRLFELGETVIEATLTPDIKIALLNRTTGKAVRSIPKKNIDPAEQKKAANELDDMRQNLKKALKIKQQQLWEDYLEAVAYPAESWKKSYLSNPFLRQIGRLLVWGQEGNTFALTETGAVTCSGAAYAITDAPIRMAHPMEMKTAEVEAWQKYFISRGLKQPFEQIWEPVHDAVEIHADRYADCHIPVVYLKNQQRRGIDAEWYEGEYYEDHHVNIKGFSVSYEQTDDPNKLEITKLVPMAWNRRTNMVISYLDRITVYDRVKKDDVSVMNQMERFTLAQLGEFISLAQENGAVNVTALLMEYKNARFPDFDPLAEFVLE